jgi:thiol:disulfide interchange protein DsbA
MIRSLSSKLALGALALGFAAAAVAQQRPPVIEINPPMPTENKAKIEVVEFFWYGCPACYSLEPHLETWIKKLPKDAEFKRVPAMFNERVAIAARVYYALEAIGEVGRLHRPLFDAIHKDGLRITDEQHRNDWLKRQNADVAKFSAAFASFAVESRLKRAAELQGAAKLDGVPTLVVNGRYNVSFVGPAGWEGRMLTIADSAIQESRKQLAAGAAKK